MLAQSHLGKLEPELRTPTFPTVWAAKEVAMQLCTMQKNLVRLTQVCSLQGGPVVFQKGRGSPQAKAQALAHRPSHLGITPTSGAGASHGSSGSNYNTALNSAEQTGTQTPGSKASKTAHPQAFGGRVSMSLQGQMAT